MSLFFLCPSHVELIVSSRSEIAFSRTSSILLQIDLLVSLLNFSHGVFITYKILYSAKRHPVFLGRVISVECFSSSQSGEKVGFNRRFNLWLQRPAVTLIHASSLSLISTCFFTSIITILIIFLTIGGKPHKGSFHNSKSAQAVFIVLVL